MSGLKYLLDTNFILGMMKNEPEVISALKAADILAVECAYSAVTRMELLGYPGISTDEEAAVQARLSQLPYLAIGGAVEDAATRLRRQRKVKLPDALIAATATCHGLELLTLDTSLKAIATSNAA